MKSTKGKSAPKRDVSKPTSKPAAELNDFQALLANLAADLILHPGRMEESDAFLAALLSRQYTRLIKESEMSKRDYKTYDERVQDHIDNYIAAWRHSLIQGWRKPSESTEVEVKSVTDQIRYVAQDKLKRNFNDF